MILILVVTIFSYIFIIKNLETTSLTSYVVKDFNQTDTQSTQYYPNMRFIKTTLFYKTEDCSELQKKRVRQAFEIISNKTKILYFYEKNNSEDILITCNKTTQKISKKFIKTGEAGAYPIINTGAFYIIKKGRISLFDNKNNCKTPNTELHEILHVLGFKHSQNSSSIMYNFSYCNQKLDKEIIDELIKLYSLESLPDVLFDDLDVSKKRSYLDFQSKVSNKGLKESENVSLEIYSKNKKIKTFELGTLKPGQGKIIDVKNLLIKEASELKFILTGKKELNQTNNLIEIFI